MSAVNQDELQEFKKLYKQEYGIELNDKIALFKAEKLLALIRAVYKPIRKADSQYVYGYDRTRTNTKT